MISNRIVEIFWVDAESTGDSGWMSLEDCEESIYTPPPVMKTCGYVLNDHDDYIVVTDSLGTEECGQVTKIPRVMVVSIHELGHLD